MKQRHTDTRTRPAERFSILIVPRNQSRIRRFELTSLGWKAMLCGGGVLAAAFVVALAAVVFYRSAYFGALETSAQSAEFMKERAGLMRRVAELEETVSRTERFAAKVEASTDAKKGQRVGQGPVEEWDALPDTPGTSKVRLGSGMWKSPFAKSLTKGMSLSLDQLNDRANKLEGQLHSVFALQQDKLHFWSSLPVSWPTRGLITSEFGAARGWVGHRRPHEGIDIAGPIGTPVMAAGDGIVTYSGYRNGYGKTVVIDHGFGISTLYGHCSTVYAEEGQRVRRGFLIGSMGNTGRSTGPHLHYEVHVDGVPVNPRFYLAGKM